MILSEGNKMLNLMSFIACEKLLFAARINTSRIYVQDC